MKFVSKVYPIYENRLADGSYEYGFVTGEQNKETKFFETSAFFSRVYKKRQKFKFLEGIKCVVDSEESRNNVVSERGNSMRLSNFDVNNIGLFGDEDI